MTFDDLCTNDGDGRGPAFTISRVSEQEETGVSNDLGPRTKRRKDERNEEKSEVKQKPKKKKKNCDDCA